MIVPVHPPVEGVAAERFRALARQLMQTQQRRRQLDFDEVCSQEIRWCSNNPHLNGCRDTYEAAIRVLVDLARLNWTIQESRFGVELQAPTFLPKRGIPPDEVARSKETVRGELLPLREAQFSIPSICDFIRRVEKPPKNSGRKPIDILIADGRELRSRLQLPLSVGGEERIAHLSAAVRPYLQLVNTDEQEEHTGLPLGEIWRYFRYTWSLPATNVPGRQLLYLIRDAAHPFHAVMGIAALNNCSMQMKKRDDFIGWTADTFTLRVEEILHFDSPDRMLASLYVQLENNITDALADIEPEGLASRTEIEKPTAEIVARLRRLYHEFAANRQEALEGVHEGDLPDLLQETEAGPYGIPLAEEVLILEKIHDQTEFRKARAAMVAKKRAFELSRLLQARLRLREIKDTFLNPKHTADVLYLEETRSAITMALLANKSRRVGANMLELTTCGAIPPYNHLLAGKLTTLLMLSPQVADDYRRRYGSEPSIISSLLKNAPLVRDSNLVYLGTTSLYALGSSQYERVRLPAGIIAHDQPELRYQRIGFTSGYGTVQFAPETVQAIETFVKRHVGFTEVNSIFGEGPSPRLRKLRTGLALLGFDPENLLRHNQHRIIYGVSLAENGPAFLRGEGGILPDYIQRPGRYRDATERITAFWTRRWLASRLNHTPAIESLSHTPAWKLSDQIPVASPVPQPLPCLEGKNDRPEAAEPSPEVEFWRSLAHAGPGVCSEQLTQSEMKHLHVKDPLEDFLFHKVREGFSLVLTGNAGDGKTHLLIHLQERLIANGIKAVVEPDATAAMKHGELAPVLNSWRKALAAKKPYLLAANEHPLYQLRKNGPKCTPSLGKILASVDSQCHSRLAYSAATTDEGAKEKVLVVDLSLRNPLQLDFAGRLLDRMIKNEALQKHALKGGEPNFTRNFERLSQQRVRDRLLGLFHRIVVRGERAPVRELWIILARLLFGSQLAPDEVPDAMNARYSERLFERDGRFRLAQLLANLADPAACSHPQWDARLEQPGSTRPTDWIESRAPMPDLHELDEARFAYLKRVFYFEHARGTEAFALEEEYARHFSQQLDEAKQGDLLLLGEILRSINLCYCPKPFRGMEDRLHLWIGHRYHEQPTRSYVANQFVPADKFEILVPRLPHRLAGAFDYQPDHFLLRHRTEQNQTVGLRIDFSLFATLAALRSGLPRHLMPDKHLNRLDAFLEQLQATSPPQAREFVAFNTQRRLATRIRLSTDWKRYVEVKENE